MRLFKGIFRRKDRGLPEKAGEKSCQLIRCVKDSLVVGCPKDGNSWIFHEINGLLRCFYCWNVLDPGYGKRVHIIERQWEISQYPCRGKSGPGFRSPGL